MIQNGGMLPRQRPSSPPVGGCSGWRGMRRPAMTPRWPPCVLRLHGLVRLRGRSVISAAAGSAGRVARHAATLTALWHWPAGPGPQRLVPGPAVAVPGGRARTTGRMARIQAAWSASSPPGPPARRRDDRDLRPLRRQFVVLDLLAEEPEALVELFDRATEHRARGIEQQYAGDPRIGVALVNARRELRHETPLNRRCWAATASSTRLLMKSLRAAAALDFTSMRICVERLKFRRRFRLLEVRAAFSTRSPRMRLTKCGAWLSAWVCCVAGWFLDQVQPAGNDGQVVVLVPAPLTHV